MKEIDQNVKNYISTYHKTSGLSKITNEQENNVKNKSFAPIQITVEQILKESYSGSTNNIGGNNSLSRIHESFDFRGIDELEDYRIRKRKEFEDSIRRKRWKISLYLSYAKWESLQNNIQNSRSILERGILVNYENVRIWRDYVKLEITNGNINNARNLFERVTHLLPRIDEFWTKYIQMEFVLKNYINVRHIYKKWIVWKPAPSVYIQYSKFEEECGEIKLAREIMKDLVSSYPDEKNFIEYIKFEQKHKNLLSAEQIINILTESLIDINAHKITHRFFLYISDVFVEEKKIEEAIKLCNGGIKILRDEHCVKNLKDKLFQLFKMRIYEKPDENIKWINHKLQYYRDRLFHNPQDFDLLFDYTIFIIQYLELDSVLQEYENLVINNNISDVINWEKYFHSCLLFTYFFEINQDANSPNIHKMYNNFIHSVKNDRISEIKITESETKPSELNNITNIEQNNIFAKVFIYFSNHQLRIGNLNTARKILGIGLGRIPCANLFDHYIDIEFKLGNFDRCRVLFTKYIEYDPISTDSWIKYMRFEYNLHEIKRVISIAEAAISMPELDSPEIIWQYYIELMINEKNIKFADSIYKRLLEKTQHIQVVINYSTFIISKLHDNKLNREFILGILNKYKDRKMDYQRSIILKYWLSLEENFAAKNIDCESKLWVEIINRLLPRTVLDINSKKKTYVFNEENYEFSHLTSTNKNDKLQVSSTNNSDKVPLPLIDAAKQWKKAKI
ncbi:crooked neck HAT repeats [Cryptosporidium sp. chipmunk genotype I]|uniref:crooked neck HAT repeats n=1 Tax=Cryptosporidium sp. chipmunk genotype I TaxID=1280935 RepID=UPI00351A70B1|nr:crooked neck HAT repeats [Cryptosporidium sp. chipmunk genotype I]